MTHCWGRKNNMIEFTRNQESDSIVEPASILIAGIGENGCRTAAFVAKEFSVPNAQIVLADKTVELSRIRLSKAERINIDLEWREEYRRVLQGCSYAFILVKLGGELETGAARLMAQVTAEMNVPFVIFAQTPITKFTSEAELRLADNALESLKSLANAIVVIPNDALFQTIPGDLPVAEAYKRATEWFAEAVASIARPFALQNLADLNASRLEWLVNRKNSICSVSMGWGDGSNMVDEAIEQLIHSPFLQGNLTEANFDAAMVILSVAPDISLEQAHQILKEVKGTFYDSIQLATCICIDDSMPEGIRLSALLRATQVSEPESETVTEAKQDAEKPAAETPKRRNAKKTKNSPGQMLLNLFAEQNLGIFSAKEPTKYGGDNLDQPTYSRCNLYIDNE